MNKEPKKGLYETFMRTSFIFLWTVNGSDAFCPSLSLFSNSDFILPYFRVCSILLLMLILDRKKAVDKRPL